MRSCVGINQRSLVGILSLMKGSRSFSRSLKDIPATLRHRVRGREIFPNKLQNGEVDIAIVEITKWKGSLEHQLVEHTRRSEYMMGGTGLQATTQAIAMLQGLIQHAVIVDKALVILRYHMKNKTKSQELEKALTNLKPYFDGTQFVFDFDPPFYLLSQN